jgi:RNA polymerase sigma-70 factor (ECF subfamily)
MSNVLIPDDQLLADLRTGDSRAVELWFAQYHDRVLQYVITRISIEKDAEEIVQETFMNCLKHLPLFRGNASIWTWMCGIAKHEISDYFRKRYAKKALRTLPLGEMLLADSVTTTSEQVEVVQKVLKNMSSEYVELLLKKYLDRKKVKDIAREVGRSVKAIESDLFRAREEFKMLWAEYATYG